MLRTLDVRDVVLIERLSLDFNQGLAVLTGETGAGKSILLDALGLATGARAEARLVRAGAEKASSSATFDMPKDLGLIELLDAHDIPLDRDLILRRTLSTDGRSRAFINDTAVGVGLLRQVGDMLVEVHGQFDNQRLTNPAQHLALLDAFGRLQAERDDVKQAWSVWGAARRTLDEAHARLAEARRDEDFLRHAVDELTALAPEPGEDVTLDQERRRLMNAEKLIQGMNDAATALTEGRGVEGALQSALGTLDRLSEDAGGALEETLGALERALNEASEATSLLDRVSQQMDLDPSKLETVEDRLFALRACARKHGVGVDQLTAFAEELRVKLAALETGEGDLVTLAKTAEQKKAAYVTAAGVLTGARQRAAAKLDLAMADELAPLKLGTACFVTTLTPLDEEAWGPLGTEKAAFEVATNPGSAPGPLAKIASGGELARFMLALKVVLAETDSVPTLVFDEVDAGIGGATASAVGERLSRLGKTLQVLVVTHSPQVAAQGAHHLRVAKAVNGASSATDVETLDAPARCEEIARMLAGTEVTPEARAAAQTLLEARV